jgi:hypothetical protein
VPAGSRDVLPDPSFLDELTKAPEANGNEARSSVAEMQRDVRWRGPGFPNARAPDALVLALIASVYIGFAVADGRPLVIAAESSVAAAFVLVAAAAVTGSPWLAGSRPRRPWVQGPLAAPPTVRRKHARYAHSGSGLAGNEHRLGEASLAGELAHEVALALERFHALRVEANRLQCVVGELHCDHVAV